MLPVVDKILSVLRNEDDFLVAGHATPDGDAYGSAVALCLLLEKLGKRFYHYTSAGVPDAFEWLAHPDAPHSSLDNFVPSWSLILDSSDIERLDPEVREVIDPERTVTIDHHLGNSLFGALNWVDVNEPSVGTMIAKLAKGLDTPLTGDLGEAIYLAMVSDTGHFSYGNTRPETLELAAEIIRLGLDPGEFNAKLEKSWTPQRLKLWSHVLGEATLHCDGQIGVIRISKDILRRTGSDRSDCDGLVEVMRRVKSVRIAVSISEADNGYVKVSLRSHGNDNVQLVARHMGGGGHKNAAGATVSGALNEVEKLVVQHGSDVLNLRCADEACAPASEHAHTKV